MFNLNRKIVKKLADSVRLDLEHQSQVDKTLYRYQQGQDQRRQDADDQKNADSLARRLSNSKQRSKSRIAAGFNPETGQAYPALQDDLDDGQIQSRPRSTRQFTATNRKIQQNLTDSDVENERDEFMLPISKEEFQEEFDVDEETELQYPTQPYLTGENLLEEYNEELNISSSNNIRTAQQSQQRLPVPASPQVSRLPIISSHQQQQHQKKVSQEYQQPFVPPLIPRSRSYNSNSPQSQSKTIDSGQNPQQQQQLYKNKTPVVTIEKTRSNSDEKYGKRSQVRRNSSAVSKSIVRTDEQQEQEVDDCDDVAEGELADDTNPYIPVRNGSNSVSLTNTRSKYERELPQQQQQQSSNTLTKVVVNRSNPILDSNVLSQREKESRRNSRRPSIMAPRVSDSDQDREYQNRDSQNSNFKGRNHSGDLSYTPSMVSRPNSNYSLTNQLQQELSISSRDVIPLPIEIPDSVTDADAFRRYLSRNTMESLGRNSMVGVGGRVGSQQIASELGGSGSRTFASGQNLNDNRRQDSFQQQQQEQQPYGQPPCCSYRQDTDCHNKAKFQSRTASLSHAIMTLALLSASAAQLRFVVAYSHAHSYPTLNYFLICSCIIIEGSGDTGSKRRSVDISEPEISPKNNLSNRHYVDDVA